MIRAHFDRPSVIAGRMMWRQPSAVKILRCRSSTSTVWPRPEAGSQPNCTAKIMISIRPTQKFGRLKPSTEPAMMVRDRKSVVEGKSVSVRVDLGGRRILTKKKKKQEEN